MIGSRSLPAIFVVISLLPIPIPLLAATRNWTGTASNVWSDSANWEGGVAPAPGDDLVFGASSRYGQLINDFPVGTLFRSIALQSPNTRNVYTLAGNEIQLSTGVTTNFTQSVLSLPITLTAHQTWSRCGFFTVNSNINIASSTLTLGGCAAFASLNGTITGTGTLAFPVGEVALTGHLQNSGGVAISYASGIITTSVTCNGCTVNGPITIQSGRFELRHQAQVGSISLDQGGLGVSTGGASSGSLIGRGSLGFASEEPAQQATLAVTGTVDLSGGMGSSLANSYTPNPGDVLTLISNDGSDPVIGTFSGQPEGSTFIYNGATLRITYVGGTGNDITLTALAVATTTTLTSAPNPSAPGQIVTFTAIIQANAGSPAGTVSFYEDSTLLGTRTVTSGSASLAVSSLATGQHSVTAVFTPSGPEYGASTSAPHTQTVTGPVSAARTRISGMSPIPADGASTTQIVVVSRDQNGLIVPQGGAEVAISTTRGMLGPITDHNNGYYAATLTSSTNGGTAIVTGRINGEPIPGDARIVFHPVTLKTKADFNGDGFADLLWRNPDTGENLIWFTQNGAITSIESLPPTGNSAMSVEFSGDFDGDGRADVLWRNRDTGEIIIWLLNGSTVTGINVISRVASQNTKIVGVGDFNGDQRDDIAWRNYNTGNNQVWVMNGLTIQEAWRLPAVPDTNVRLEWIGDFNGDVIADILLRDPASGQISVWLMDGATILESSVLTTVTNPLTEIGGVGDITGDRVSDILWRNYSNGNNQLWEMNGSQFNARNLMSVPDLNARIVGLSKFDFNSFADILWRNFGTTGPDAGRSAVWLMTFGYFYGGSDFGITPQPWQLVAPR